MTTPAEKEADHIRLRLQAGFHHVAMISANRQKLNRIRETFFKSGHDAEDSKVGFYTPEEFVTQLYGWAADDPEGGLLEKGKPKKQNFDFGSTPENEARRIESEIVMLADLKNIMARNRGADFTSLRRTRAWRSSLS